MISLFIKNKRFMEYDELVSPYGKFFTVDIGITSVNPNDIIGLSIPQKELEKDTTLKRLRSYIKKKGWINKHPHSIHLIRLPNLKYTVGNKGNRRSYLANECKLNSILAYVSVLIPEKMLVEDMYRLKKLFADQKKFAAKARQIRNWLEINGKSEYEGINYKEENDLLQSLCYRENQIVKEINSILMRVAIKNDLINERELM
ncbi:hypothetical protein QA612_15095 [Evansella sp. AB-P1]|uniref:hypothetical protein n=1 Tax=Evansella sp. AB-P1 TaxID=3037653 RepID=UPI00241FD7E4|nr:hypothetical protein [Evansella sp. AB-P1]MDG5788796.1 hypothetical protein [Evansella sp. AB-P1]